MALNQKFEDKIKFYLDILNINVVFDIGAYYGDFSSIIKNNFPKILCLMFEANKNNNNYLETLKYPFFNALLSNEDNKEVIFYKPKNGISTGSSIYKENSTFFDESLEIKMKTITLDTLIRQLNLPYPDLIKLDVQGAELDVLNGLSIYRPKFIIIESSFCKFNIGAPLIGDIFDYMNKKNYRCIDILDENKKKITYDKNDVKIEYDITMYVDLLFIQNELCDKDFFVDNKITYI